MSDAIAKVLLDYARNWVRVPREAIETLASDPLTLTVFALIVSRARWTPGSVLRGGHGVVDLGPGQAVFGREEMAKLCNATVAKVRTAIQRLEKLRYVTTRTTSRGTVATVLNYTGSGEASSTESPAGSPEVDQHIASTSPADDQHIATNKKEEGKKPRREKGKKEEGRALVDADALRLAGLLVDQIASASPGTTIAKLSAEARKEKAAAWAPDIDKLHRLDGIPLADIESTIVWCQADPFWRSNILCGEKLREKYNQLTTQRARGNGKAPAMPAAADYETVPAFMRGSS